MPNQAKGAIVGLGVTPMGKIYGRRAVDFAAEAIALALDDAGLTKDDVDGLLINANIPNDMDPAQRRWCLGLENLTLVNVMSAYGSTAGSMMQYACMAIREGLANVVVLVYADAPLSPSRGAGQSYAGPHRFRWVAWPVCAPPTAISVPIPNMPWRPGGTCISTARPRIISVSLPSASANGRR